MHENKEEKLLNEILPNVAAQLRGSLGNIHVAMQHLAPTGGEDTAAERDLAIINQSYYRLLRVVNNLSAAPMLLQTDTIQLQNVELVSWLDGLCRQAQPLAEEAGLELTFSCALPHHIVGIHKEHLARLVWNLLSNAIKFTSRGGKVTVSLRVAGSQVLLSVEDNGCGIKEELQETVFDRYLHAQRMDPLPHGLGLGLPLCRRIAEGHGGRLLLQSREGEGTTVTCALPDRRAKCDVVRDVPFDYAGGFQTVLVELADALPYGAFRPRHID